MTAQTKMRASVKDGITEVRLLMQHEMENGRRKDESGKPIPAWFITEFKAQHNDRTVLEGQFGASVSKNPYLIFHFSGGAPGDRVALSWVDNRGEARTDEAAIS